MKRDLHEVALNLLTRREHTAAELTQKLKMRGFAADEIEAEIERLSAVELLSDQRFAASYLEARLARGYGPLKIVFELKNKGITEEASNNLVKSIASDVWENSLRELYQKKFPQKIRDFADKARRMRFLLSRGFTKSQINQVINYAVPNDGRDPE